MSIFHDIPWEKSLSIIPLNSWKIHYLKMKKDISKLFPLLQRSIPFHIETDGDLGKEERETGKRH